MGRLWRRLGYVVFRGRREEELAAEMEFHREMAARGGGGRFGNELRLREEAREAWGWTWIDRLAQDVRYAVRGMAKSPGFVLGAVVMLAIGIGANVAAFGFFDLMVLRPLNVRSPESLLRFHRRSPQGYAFALPYPETQFFRRNSRTLAAVLTLHNGRLSMEGEEKKITAHFVSGNYFTELGAAVEVGRLMEEGRDEAPGAEAVVVLSHGFWQRHYGSDPLAAGRTIRLNGKPATVIGVASGAFGGLSLETPDVWAPITQQPYFESGSRLLSSYTAEGGGAQMWGRLRAGLGPKAAEDELKGLAEELHRRYPGEIWEQESIPSEPGGYATALMIGNRSGTGSEGRNQMYPLMALAGALVALILGVACANLGGLLLARGVARQREISIRVSVGAGTGRLIRQLFTESLVLAAAGAAAGLFVGWLLLRSLMAVTGLPAWLSAAPDWRIAVFAAGMGMGASILFGLAPAWQVARQRHRAGATRQILVGAQVAASSVLLIVSGLLGRALDHAVSTPPGFAWERVISVEPGLSGSGYTPAKARAYLETLESRLRALPGVEAVSVALVPPLGRVSITAGVTIDGRDVEAQVNHVSPEFFQTMEIPLLRGRNLTRGEAREAIVSESLARAAWPGQDPLGKKLELGPGYTVVGVARSARMVKLEDSDAVEAYLPVEEADAPLLFVLVRGAPGSDDLPRLVASTARSIDANAYPEIHLVKSGFGKKLQEAAYGAVAVSVLGGIAHLLACLGIVGVVAYTVSQRTKEIGIRVALGARRAQVLGAVLRQFPGAVGVGTLLGIGTAAAVSRVLRGVLYGISNLDPAAYAAAIAVFVVTVAGAALAAAWRALWVDPWRALRHE